MMKKRTLWTLSAVLLLTLAYQAWAAMTVTRYPAAAELVNKVTLAWTSDGSGAATQAITLRGTILRVVTNPGATAPTDNYDLTAPDADGVDVFGGQGANRDTANSEHFCPGLPLADGTTTSTAPISVNGEITLTIANAGASKEGSITIYYR